MVCKVEVNIAVDSPYIWARKKYVLACLSACNKNKFLQAETFSGNFVVVEGKNLQ